MTLLSPMTKRTGNPLEGVAHVPGLALSIGSIGSPQSFTRRLQEAILHA